MAVQSQEKRDRLAALAGNQAHIRQAPLILAWLPLPAGAVCAIAAEASSIAQPGTPVSSVAREAC